MKKFKDLSETPYGVLKKLYSLRLKTDQTVAFEEYVERYRFISVKKNAMEDETAYTASDDTWRKEQWKEGICIKGFTISDAIIYNGAVIKNRYGCEEKITSTKLEHC